MDLGVQPVHHFLRLEPTWQSRPSHGMHEKMQHDQWYQAWWPTCEMRHLFPFPTPSSNNSPKGWLSTAQCRLEFVSEMTTKTRVEWCADDASNLHPPTWPSRVPTLAVQCQVASRIEGFCHLPEQWESLVQCPYQGPQRWIFQKMSCNAKT